MAYLLQGPLTTEINSLRIEITDIPAHGADPWHTDTAPKNVAAATAGLIPKTCPRAKSRRNNSSKVVAFTFIVFKQGGRFKKLAEAACKTRISHVHLGFVRGNVFWVFWPLVVQQEALRKSILQCASRRFQCRGAGINATNRIAHMMPLVSRYRQRMRGVQGAL
jgi:hypothetical protein